jgi:hypothetical protein
VNDGHNVNLGFQYPVDDTIWLFEKLAEAFVLILRNHGPEFRMSGQLTAPSEDSLDHAACVLFGMPPDISLDSLHVR